MKDRRGNELGPALGLVEIREPTPEECVEIAWRQNQIEFIDISDDPTTVVKGRAMFDAVKAVLWPKEGL